MPITDTSAKARAVAEQRGLALLIAGALLGACSAPAGRAQDDKGLAGIYDAAVKATEAGDNGKALSLVDKAIQDYSDGARERYGPVFGSFYFLKGMVLIRQKKYQEALEPLKTCYEKWGNEILDEADKNKIKHEPNRFHTRALVQWGTALMALEQFEEAGETLGKALLAPASTRTLPIDRFNVQINLAQCYIKSGKPERGKDFIRDVIDSGRLYPSQQLELMMILAWQWSPERDFDEVRDTIATRSEVFYAVDAESRYSHNRYLYALASKAMQAGEPVRALLWYSLAASPPELIWQDEIRKRQYAARRATAEIQKDDYVIKRADELLKEVDEDIARKRKDWAAQLLGTSAAYYQMEAIAAARAGYREFVANFPGHERRPDALHNLVICDVELEQWMEAYRYGKQFFDEFPEHPLLGSVARVLVEVIFVQGEYQRAHDVCAEIRPQMKEGSAEREIPDFVAGASAFHLDKFEEAEENLENYQKTYPEGSRLEPARFYLGSTKVRLSKWEEAAKVLDDFLEKYPESEMRPPALFLSGLAHQVLEDPAVALKRVDELQQKFPEAAEIPASHNLKGDILAGGDGDPEAVLEEYGTAKKLFEKENRGDTEVAAYATQQMVATAGKADQDTMAVQFYDDFKGKYWDTSFRVDTALAAANSLVEAGRKDEMREQLLDFVNDAAAAGNSGEIDLLFGSYLDFLDKNYGVEEKVKQLAEFPFRDPANPNPTLRAWTIMAQIEALEGAQKAAQYKEEIDRLFYSLNAIYERKGLELSNYVLVRLARWNWQKRKKEEEARKIYEFILNERKASGDALGFALVDLGKLDAQSRDESNRDRAYERFSRVLAEVENSELREEATLGMARILTGRKDWEAALGRWKEYLANRGWNLVRPEANYRVAECTDMLGQQAEALKYYVSVYANFAGHLDWSTRAYLRTAVLLRGQSKKAEALKVLQDMLKRMGHLDHKGVEVARETFFKWRDEYLAETAGKQ